MRTVKQVATASGVSVRALHHYDHIGLLKPNVGANGYRYYGQAELLRLQHILLYREGAIGLGAWTQLPQPHAITTAPGEQRTVAPREAVRVTIERRQNGEG